MKIKKNQRKKKFRYHVNRRKMKTNSTKLKKTEWEVINNTWDKKKSAQQNLEAMGLAHDPNLLIKIPSVKEMLTPHILGKSDEIAMEEEKEANPVVAALEKFAKLPRKKSFKLPNNDLHWIAYLVARHKEDYKAMARDPKNVYQETWRQIRAKIYKFINTHQPELKGGEVAQE